MGWLPLSAYNIKFDGDERLQTEAAKTGKFFVVNLARQCHLNQFRCTFLLVLQLVSSCACNLS